MSAPTGEIRVAVGSFTDPTDERLTFARQIGASGVTINTPWIPSENGWELADLIHLRERCEQFGLRLEAIENTPMRYYDKAILGLPGRDEQIALFQKSLRNMGRAGIPTLGYHWMANGVWRTSRSTPGRGNAQATAFDADKVASSPLVYGFGGAEVTQAHMVPVNRPELTHGRVYGEDELWEYFRYFMDAVLPVAEESAVRLALHPDDPPVEQLGGIARLMRDRRGFERAMEIGASPCHGLIFCVGTWAEMGTDPAEMIRHFGARDQIVFCHFRDVSGRLPSFRECFMGEGGIDFVAVVRALRASGFDGFVIDDHVPTMIDDTPWGHRGRALSTGYINGLIDAVLRIDGGSSPRPRSTAPASVQALEEED